MSSTDEQPLDALNDPPEIRGGGNYHRIDSSTPLHRLAAKRYLDERDLKIIITADDSETGVGKTTLASWLAMNWSWIFGGIEWTADQYSTTQPQEYFSMVSSSPKGSVILVDDAEELDARRSMQDLNVKFSWWWMLMRLRQVFTIITLPSPASIDSRLEELADVWINIMSRGVGKVHDIGVQAYGSRNVTTEKVHDIGYPDISDHPELETLQEKKEEKMTEWEKEVQQEAQDASDELGKTQQTFLAIATKEKHELPWVEVPDHDERLTYSGEFYRQKSKELLGED